MKKTVVTILLAVTAVAYGSPSVRQEDTARLDMTQAQLETVITRHLQHFHRTVPALSNIELLDMRQDFASTAARVAGKQCRFELVRRADSSWTVQRQQCDNE